MTNWLDAQCKASSLSVSMSRKVFHQLVTMVGPWSQKLCSCTFKLEMNLDIENHTFYLWEFKMDVE